MPMPTIRKGMPGVELSKDEFAKRFRERFYDPSFVGVSGEIGRLMEVAWQNYIEYHKSPRTRRAGQRFRDRDFRLPVEWLHTKKALPRPRHGRKGLDLSRAFSWSTARAGAIRLALVKYPKPTASLKPRKRLSGVQKDSRSTCWISADSLRSMEESFTHAKPVCRRPCLCVTGRASATRTTPWDR